jgi:flagellar biosynthesis protein FliP
MSVPRPLRLAAAVCAAALAVLILVVGAASPAAAQVTPAPVVEPTDPGVVPADAAAPDSSIRPQILPAADDDAKASISIDLPTDSEGQPNQSVLVILLITLLAVAPALLVMLTSFTRIVIVLSLTRNALGLQSIPPNQVIVGLAMFLSLFVMSPTLTELNDVAIQPLLKGDKTTQEAYDAGVKPMRAFMMKQTGKAELAMFVSADSGKKPGKPDDVSMAALVPAFILSELKTAFIIGFIVFIPFLVIDIVVSSSLMSMGMMMLPPVVVSLPFKLLLFVMVDGWGLVVKSLLTSFK